MKNSLERVLALEVHPLSFGFAVFEGPDQVIDWGVRSFPRGMNAVKVPMAEKLALIIGEYRPRVVVVARPHSRAVHRLRVIKEVATVRGVQIRVLPRDLANKTFPNALNKDDRAVAVANRIPTLSQYVPPRRKPWKREHYRMSIFGAAAIGVAHFDQGHALRV